MGSAVPPASLALALALTGCSRELALPPEIARSEYIAYHTDADASVICMDDLLAREDRFLERAAMTLGVAPPAGTVHFVWDPEQDGEEPWACDANANCYKHLDDGRSVVVSKGPTNHHELVHAIEAQALGTDVHRTLVEGLAEYLGSLQTSAFGPGRFPMAFKAMLAASPVPGDYALAMHFVGSLLERDGPETYKELRAALPPSAGVDAFAAAFEAVYGESLDSALAAMSGARVDAVDRFAGCDEAPALAWTDAGTIDATIASACGDPWFFGAGFVEARVGFFGYYVVDVPEAGEYALTVGPAAGAPAPLRGSLGPCSFDLLGSAVLSLGGQTAKAQLQRGRHTLLIAFPPRSEARGDATVQLERVGPPPAP